MTDAERAARCAWIVYLDTLIAGTQDERAEALRATVHTLAGLHVRELHLKWRGDVLRALDSTLQTFCPGGDPSCCDEGSWPKPDFNAAFVEVARSQLRREKFEQLQKLVDARLGKIRHR